MKHKRQGNGSKNCDENASKSSSCGNEDEDSLDGLHVKQSQGRRRRIKSESGGGRGLRTETKGCGPGSEDEDSGTDDGSDLKGGHADDHDLDKLLPSPEDMDHSLSSKEDQLSSSGVTAACPSLAAISHRLPQTLPTISSESRIPATHPPAIDDSAKHFYPRSATFAPTQRSNTYESSTSSDFACHFPQTRDYSHSSSSSNYTATTYFGNESQSYTGSGYPSVTTASCADGNNSNSSSSSSASPFQSGSVPGATASTFGQHSYYDATDIQSRENLPPNVESEYTGYCMNYASGSGASGHSGHNPQSQRSYYENYSCQYRDAQSGSHFQRPMYTSDGYTEADSSYSSSGYGHQQQTDHSLSHFSHPSSNASVPTNQSPLIDPYVHSNNNYFEMFTAVNF